MEGTSQEPQTYDLLILTDATMSMGSYLAALNASLPKIISVSALTDAFARIGILAYRDYCGGQLTEWSGWYGQDGDISRDTLISFARNLKATSGGDWPEATKTGLARAYSVMRPQATTLILLYTDAPPHMPWNKESNRIMERAMLASGIFGPSSGRFVDWVSATRTIGGDVDPPNETAIKAQVFSIVQSHLVDTLSPYVYICHETKGSCLEINSPNSDHIASLTMSLLLAWMGVGVSKPGTGGDGLATLITYKDVSNISQILDENDPDADVYFLQVDKKAKERLVRSNLTSTVVDDELLQTSITPRTTPVVDFAKRYVEDEEYRGLVIEHLGNIIREDVSAIALNPVFGSLWRVVCNDRTNDARDTLIQAFGTSIEKITRHNEKEKLRVWLAESYNYAAEIAAIIEEVEEQDRYPCVFLDPTQDWKIPAAEVEDDESPVSITSFTRDELLEIGRSCDYKILRRLGRVLTRLTYVNSKDELPAHIKEMSEEEVPRIPLALTASQYKRCFWKILLHIVVPGTKLGARPAALLAALSIRMGLKPLTTAADSEMIAWKNNWNSLEIPETWNTNCLALILDADKDFEARRKDGEIVGDTGADVAFLKEEDRQLFERLVDYSMLRANLNTSLSAKVGWRPEKSKVPIGPLVICSACQYPRSVTIMAPMGICGLCMAPENDFGHGRTKSEVLALNVSTDVTEAAEATWVECSVSTCRAQYIIYDADGLRVRPKCHYCRLESNVSDNARNHDPAPWVECTKCLNRMIWPEEYRPIDQDFASFQCTACSSGRATIIDVETTPKSLSEENGNVWLLRNTDKKIKKPLGDMSLYKTIVAAGIEDFVTKVEVLPESEDISLKIHGKLVRNAEEIKASLLRWIKSRRAEAGTCSLCFDNVKKKDLRSACGRSGCAQNICSGCRQQWYGINARGRLINVAALSCPFCRRQPAAKAVPGNGLVYLGGLRNAVDEAGEWIYAWCNDCGIAKRFVERVCAQGAPAEVSQWDCDECKDKKKGEYGRNKIRNCPGCGTATEKMGGCDHISCPCGTHWCFFCGENPSPVNIYRHIADMHSGYYGEEEEDYDEEEYDM